MTWFKVDDGFWSHPKVLNLSDSAVALWTRAGAYCCQHLTDGVVSSKILRVLGDEKAATELVESGLWRELKAGYKFHDWGDYQETSDTVKERRKQARERMQKLRAGRKSSPERSQDVRANKQRTNSERSQDVREKFATPDPTRPDPTIEERKGKKENEQVAHNQTVSPPPSSFIPYGSLDDPRCARHRDLPKEQVPACRDCGKAREVWQQRADDAKAEKRRVIDECDWCDSRGIAELHDADGRPVAVKCDHTNPPQPPPPPEPFKPLRTKKKPLW